MGRRADRLFTGRVEYHYIGVRADGDRSFLREQAENLGGGGRGQFDEAVEADAPLGHAVVIDQAHSVLDAGAAVRNLAEIAAPQFILFLVAVRDVVVLMYLLVVSA